LQEVASADYTHYAARLVPLLKIMLLLASASPPVVRNGCAFPFARYFFRAEPLVR